MENILDLDFYEKLLHEKKKLIEIQRKNYEMHLNSIEYLDNPIYDNDSQLIRNRLEELLIKLDEKENLVEKALLRIEDGSYGLCCVCGKFIGNVRLKVTPDVTTCLLCEIYVEK